MFTYDEASAEERIFKVLTDKETGETRIDSTEYALMAMDTARALDRELDVVLLKLYAIEQDIANLESALSDCAYRRECLKTEPESEWRKITARESERRMRSVVDRISASHDIKYSYNDFFSDED